MTVPPDHWFGVVTYFEELSAERPDFKPLAELVQEIAASRFSTALYPWTAADDLCLAQAPSRLPVEAPHLRLRLMSDAAIEFLYIEGAMDPHLWRRVEPVELAYGRLLIFFDQLNWFGPESGRR